MTSCSNCGEKVEEGSDFCQNCGFKLKENGVISSNPSFEKNRNTAMILFGYMTLVIEIIAIFACWYHLKLINADRIVLYPLLSVMLSFFASFNLVKNEKTFIHSVIIVIISLILFIIGIVAV